MRKRILGFFFYEIKGIDVAKVAIKNDSYDNCMYNDGLIVSILLYHYIWNKLLNSSQSKIRIAHVNVYKNWFKIEFLILLKSILNIGKYIKIKSYRVLSESLSLVESWETITRSNIDMKKVSF